MFPSALNRSDQLLKNVKHDDVQVVGEKDGDGFYWGEAGGKAGFVPCNMVSEVQVIRHVMVSLLCGSQYTLCTNVNT